MCEVEQSSRYASVSYRHAAFPVCTAPHIAEDMQPYHIDVKENQVAQLNFMD